MPNHKPTLEQMAEADVSALVDYCIAFAGRHGIDQMLDTLAGVYQAFAPLSEDTAIKIVCDLADLEVETVRVQ